MSHSSKCRNIIKSFSLFHLPPTEHLSHLFPPSIYVSSSSLSQTPGLQRNISTSHEGAEYNGGETTDPPRLFVVQPRLRPDTLLKTKLNEALSLANSLEDQRDGYFLTDFAKKELPPHAVVQNPLDRSTRGRADTYFGLGTVDNIKCHLNAVESEGELDAVYVNAILSGTQQRNLERAWGKPVLDRMALIIEIFHAHAFTKEAKLQAELAALMYKKTRLVRVRSGDGRSTFGAPGEAGAEVVSARGRGSGGRGFISGAGETELELQRRRISERRTRLLAEIEEVRRTRAVQRSARKRRGSSDGRGLATIAIVGYTNAGKSTLVNVLSDSDLYSDDRLFATVDPRLRGITLPSGRTVLLSDTVGFISDLPVQLVEAFHATLEEVVEADLLVHVLDSSAQALVEQRSAVLQVLEQIGVSEEKIQNMIEVWNKIDLEEKHDLEQYIDNGVDNEEELLSCEVDDMSLECLPVEHNMEESDCASSAEYGKNLSVQLEEETNVGKGICPNTKLSTDDELGSGDQDNSLGGLDDHLKKSPNSLGMEGEVLKSSREWAPDVKTSALMGVGLKELLELIDEKLDVLDGKLKVGRIVQRSAFDKKWRPPQSKESIIAGEVEQ